MDFTSEQVAALDAACRKQQVLTLSEVRRRYWPKYKAIIENQRIRNDMEYNLAVGLLSDTAASMPTVERELLQTLVSAYEQRFAQQGGRTRREKLCGFTLKPYNLEIHVARWLSAKRWQYSRIDTALIESDIGKRLS